MPSIRTTRARSARPFEALEFDFDFDSDWIQRVVVVVVIPRRLGFVPRVVSVGALACLGRATFFGVVSARTTDVSLSVGVFFMRFLQQTTKKRAAVK